MDNYTLELLTFILLVILGVGVVAAAFGGAYLLGKDRGRREVERSLKSGDLDVAGHGDNDAGRTNRALDALSVEVERLAEAQRYTAKLLADDAAAKRPTES